MDVEAGLGDGFAGYISRVYVQERQAKRKRDKRFQESMRVKRRMRMRMGVNVDNVERESLRVKVT